MLRGKPVAHRYDGDAKFTDEMTTHGVLTMIAHDEATAVNPHQHGQALVSCSGGDRWPVDPYVDCIPGAVVAREHSRREL